VPTASTVVRLRTVFTPEDSGLLTALLADFEAQTQYRVEMVNEEDVYGSARKGLADIVISHYGHKDVDSFVMEGSGRWPAPVFSNQLALFGPPEDPAHISGLTDLAVAYQKIADTKSPFVVNSLPGLGYLLQIVAEVDGNPDRSGWYLDEGLQKEAAIRSAAARGAYTTWGITPFFKLQATEHLALAPMVVGDPILQRMMVSVVVTPEKYPGVNVDGAVALQKFLLAPKTQAKIRAFRIPEVDAQLWWPAARNNNLQLVMSGGNFDGGSSTDAAPTANGSDDAAVVCMTGSSVAYLCPCLLPGGQGDCATGLVCFNFPNYGARCTHTCSMNGDCASPSSGCNGMGVCKAQ
jgi:tungstate transport system substrate-binding protein